MRSIRLSLTIYILVLLAMTLGGVSLFVYGTTRETLEEKRQTSRQLATERHDKAKRDIVDQLDVDLLRQARTVAEEAQFPQAYGKMQQFHKDWDRWQQPSHRHAHQAVQLLAAGTTLQAAPHALLFWSTEASKRSFPWTLNWRFMASLKPEIRMNNRDPLPPVADHVPEYFQINSAWGKEYFSHSLRQQSIRFPFDAKVFDPAGPAIDWGQDDFELAPGLMVRRVWLLAPAARLVPLNTLIPRGGRTWGNGPGQGPPPTTSADARTQPALYIQFACELSQYDAAILKKTAAHHEELDKLVADTDDALDTLRLRLFIINGAAFVAMIAGVTWFVGLGLAPLRRVSDAVSKVTERDFSLHFDKTSVPGELSPIVDRLKGTFEQLEHAFAREKQATADISHELRTPLAALMTTIEVTLRKPRSAEEYRDALEDCQTSGRQIGQAVERLLALARLDAGVDRVRTETVDASDVARQCLAVIRPLAEARGLNLALHAEESALVQTDPDKLREILSNLLHNAIQYNRPQGSIEVDVHRDDEHLHMCVRDTGIGIAPAARPRIFERFFRADPSRGADGLHAGLGLAIVKGYLDLMGGTINVDSQEGEGSTFHISLPLAA